MAVTVYRHPLLLLEAEELVYALVNGDAPEQLSRRGGNGLHPADAAALGPAAQALMAAESRCTDLYVLARPDPAQTGPGQELRSVPVMR